MFLQQAYEAANGRIFTEFDFVEIGKSLGMDQNESQLFATEMYRRGLFDGLSMGGTTATLTESALDIAETIETSETPPPTAEEIRTMISSPQNCVINVNSTVTDSKLAVEVAQDKWWSSLGPAAVNLIRGLLTGS